MLQCELQSAGCSGDKFAITVLKSVFAKAVDEFDMSTSQLLHTH